MIHKIQKTFFLISLLMVILMKSEAQQADQHQIKAGILLQFKMYQEAQDALTQSQSFLHNPDYDLLGKICLGLNDYSRALENFQKYEQQHSGKTCYQLARCESLLGNQANAIDYLKQYLKSVDKLPVNRIMNDSAFFSIKNSEKWNKLWQDVNYSEQEIAVNKVNAAANGSPDSKFSDLITESLRQFPKQPQLLYQQAKLYDDKHMADLSLQYINQALLYQPANDSYFFEKARMALKYNILAEALPAINKAILVNPYIPEYYFTRIQINQALGNKEQADSDLKLLEYCMPDLTQVKITKVQLDIQNGKNLEALTTLNELIKFDQSKPLYYLLRGKIELKGGQFENADKDLGMALDLDPNHVETNLEKGNVLFKMMDKESACYYWQNAANRGNREAKENYLKNCAQ